MTDTSSPGTPLGNPEDGLHVGQTYPCSSLNGTDKLFFEVEYNTKSECSLVPEHSTFPARSRAQTLPCTIDLINSMREGH